MATKIIKGASLPKSELNAYQVGMCRLQEIGATIGDFNRNEIEFIGNCSIDRVTIVLGTVGTGWAIQGREDGDAKFVACYKIHGKRSVRIQKEKRRYVKPLSKMTAAEIFAAGKGAKPSRRKAPKPRLKERIAYSEKMEKFNRI